MSADERLQAIAREHPEWQPWLAVVATLRAEANSGSWDDAVPKVTAAKGDDEPMLAGASLRLPQQGATRFYARLVSAARGHAARASAAVPDDRARTALLAALDGDLARAAAALNAAADSELPAALATLLPLPLLEACARRWSNTLSPAWRHGYCPVCGGWPAFAELCGVERKRFLRCGRCGCAWHRPVLACAYCGNDDHKALLSLVAEREGPAVSIEACAHCHGYTKSFTRLTATSADTVMLEDLASAELDVAATARGYHRPAGVGRAPHATATP